MSLESVAVEHWMFQFLRITGKSSFLMPLRFITVKNQLVLCGCFILAQNYSSLKPPHPSLGLCLVLGWRVPRGRKRPDRAAGSGRLGPHPRDVARVSGSAVDPFTSVLPPVSAEASLSTNKSDCWSFSLRGVKSVTSLNVSERSQCQCRLLKRRHCWRRNHPCAYFGAFPDVFFLFFSHQNTFIVLKEFRFIITMLLFLWFLTIIPAIIALDTFIR